MWLNGGFVQLNILIKRDVAAHVADSWHEAFYCVANFLNGLTVAVHRTTLLTACVWLVHFQHTRHSVL